jgi:SNF2 family DNA or RNA helicase
VLITIYSQLYHKTRNNEIYQTMDFEILVLDEAHIIRNPKAQVNKLCMTIKANIKLLLSGMLLLNSISFPIVFNAISLIGTPVQNKSNNWVQLVRLLQGGNLTEDKYYRKGFHEEIKILRNSSKKNSYTKNKNVEQVVPFQLRRMKSKVEPEIDKSKHYFILVFILFFCFFFVLFLYLLLLIYLILLQ